MTSLSIIIPAFPHCSPHPQPFPSPGSPHCLEIFEESTEAEDHKLVAFSSKTIYEPFAGKSRGCTQPPQRRCGWWLAPCRETVVQFLLVFNFHLNSLFHLLSKYLLKNYDELSIGLDTGGRAWGKPTGSLSLRIYFNHSSDKY